MDPRLRTYGLEDWRHAARWHLTALIGWHGSKEGSSRMQLRGHGEKKRSEFEGSMTTNDIYILTTQCVTDCGPLITVLRIYFNVHALIFSVCEGSSKAIKHAKKLWYQYFWLWRPRSLTHTVDTIHSNINQQQTGWKYSQGFSFIWAQTLRQGIYLVPAQIIALSKNFYFHPNKCWND